MSGTAGGEGCGGKAYIGHVILPDMNPTTNPALQPLPDPSRVNMAAVQDSSHPHHLFSLGQFIGLGLLALSAFNAQNKPGAGPIIFTDPAVISQYLQGIASLFPGL